MISVSNVSFSYDDGTPALEGVSLDVPKGEFLCIVGHNGSGKSTLAKMLNGLLLPSSGTVTVAGMDTADNEHILDIRRLVGMVFQNPDNQIVTTVVREDVAFGPENLGVPTEEMAVRVDEAIKAVGMESYAESAPHMLSGGQKQRIAIAGMLAMDPEVLVLDEATAMLDPIGRREVLSAIETLHREKGITVILITHHMNEAEHADRVLVLNDGRLAMDGTPREVFARAEELSAIGLTVPDTVALLRALKAGGLVVATDAVTVEECSAEIARALVR